MMLFLVNIGFIVLFVYLITRENQEEELYDEEYFLAHPFALEEYQQMPTEFQSAFFRKHKEWIKEKYMDGDSFYLGYCPNKDIRRAWLSEFLQRKDWNSTSPSS